MTKYVCMCQDSTGTPHNKLTTKKQFEQDGMCSECAGHVWTEINSKSFYHWKHKAEKKGTENVQGKYSSPL